MSVIDVQNKQIDIAFTGGLLTDIPTADVPPGLSPNNQDCDYLPRAVTTRYGTGPSIFNPIAGNPTINYLKTYHQPNLTGLLLSLDSNGALWQSASIAGGLTQITGAAPNFIVPGARGKSTTLFGREYIGLSDGKFGLDIPRQYDGTFFDRVSQVGPGAPPAVNDGPGSSGNIVASPNGLIPLTSAITHIASDSLGYVGVSVTGSVPSTLQVGDKLKLSGTTDFDGEWTVASIGGSEILVGPGSVYNTIGTNGTVQYNLTTVTTTAANGLVAGGTGIIAGAGVSGYDGTWNVRAVTSSTTSVLYITGADALADSGAGTVTTAGTISIGVHQLVVLFVTRQGFITKPSPPTKWTAGGNLGAAVGQIPIGPANITQRILAFTAAGGATFFYLPSMIINDNVTTSAVVNFTDAALSGGAPVELLFNQVELEECSGLIGYASRLIAWGMRNYIQEFQNLSFDGGFNGNTPLGWTSDPTNGAGGFEQTGAVWWGDAYGITGDGAAAIKGMITQPAYQNYLGTQIIQPGTAYSARIRLLRAAGINQGNAVVELYSPSLGSFGTFVTPVGNMLTTAYTEFVGPLMGAQPYIPSDLVLRYYLNGTPTNGGIVNADNLEIFPTNEPYNSGFARASSVDDPESFDGVNGLLEIPTNEPIRTMFVLADRSQLITNDHLYAVTDNTIYRTQDNGGDPATWTWAIVSAAVGTPSVHGVDVGEDWAMIAHPSGLYLYYFGSEPTKISQEVQTITPGSPAPVSWDSINWQNGFEVWVKVDVQNKRVLIGAPTGGAAVPNKILMMNYRGLVDSSQIISTPPMHPSYTGRFIAMAIGRKWSTWSISANACWIEPKDTPLAIPAAGAGAVFLGNSAGNGKIYNLTSANGYLDDGANIP